MLWNVVVVGGFGVQLLIGSGFVYLLILEVCGSAFFAVILRRGGLCIGCVTGDFVCWALLCWLTCGLVG